MRFIGLKWQNLHTLFLSTQVLFWALNGHRFYGTGQFQCRYVIQIVCVICDYAMRNTTIKSLAPSGCQSAFSFDHRWSYLVILNGFQSPYCLHLLLISCFVMSTWCCLIKAGFIYGRHDLWLSSSLLSSCSLLFRIVGFKRS